MKEVVKRIASLAESENLTLSALEMMIGASKGTLTRAAAHGSSIQAKWLVAIASKFPHWPYTWILTGEDVEAAEKKNADLVPELPVYAAAGFTDDIDNGITPTVCIMRPRVQDLPAYDLTLTVWGDSMSPTFESGDRLALRRCANITEWGMPHVVDTTEGVYVKRIKDAGECISCTSDNAAYPPFDIPKSCIRGIYKVVALLRVC